MKLSKRAVEIARLRDALGTIANDLQLLLDGDDFGGMHDSEIFEAMLKTVRVALGETDSK